MSVVKLVSADQQEYEVDVKVACMSVTIKNMLEDTSDRKTPLMLPRITGATLATVIKYCEYHCTDTGLPSQISLWDEQFCKVDQATIFELILAANYLDIKPLLDLACQTVAHQVKGKTAEEIRRLFQIKNDFTPEEEEQIRKENEWCEES